MLDYWFIGGGQIAYVAEVGDEFVTEYDRRDSRLSVVYDNGAESDVPLRSLQRALHWDNAGRRIIDVDHGPLFSSEIEECDETSGTIYVLQSKSDHPVVVANRDILHKICVTGCSVEHRFHNAKVNPTFLIATWRLMRPTDFPTSIAASLETSSSEYLIR